jgi:hypothetical protein
MLKGLVSEYSLVSSDDSTRHDQPDRHACWGSGWACCEQQVGRGLTSSQLGGRARPFGAAQQFMQPSSGTQQQLLGDAESDCISRSTRWLCKQPDSGAQGFRMRNGLPVVGIMAAAVVLC